MPKTRPVQPPQGIHHYRRHDHIKRLSDGQGAVVVEETTRRLIVMLDKSRELLTVEQFDPAWMLDLPKMVGRQRKKAELEGDLEVALRRREKCRLEMARLRLKVERLESELDDAQEELEEETSLHAAMCEDVQTYEDGLDDEVWDEKPGLLDVVEDREVRRLAAG